MVSNGSLFSCNVDIDDDDDFKAEDLFYDMPTRLKSFKSPSEEYNRILDVVGRYAIHNSSVGFTCKKVQYMLIYLCKMMWSFTVIDFPSWSSVMPPLRISKLAPQTMPRIPFD